MAAPVDISTRELCEKIESTRNATLTLLKDTKWPPESNGAAQNLLQIVNTILDVTSEVLPVKDDAKRTMEAVYSKVKKASEKYGMRERGFRDGIKHYMSSLRPSKCTHILRTCQEDIKSVSSMLRSCTDIVGVTDPASSEIRGGLEVPVGPQAQSNAPHVGAGSRSGSPARPSAPQAKPADRTPSPSADTLQDQQNHGPIRNGVLTAARKTFKTVETVSGAIPGVGYFVGVVAKVGLAFVNMVETMDKNEEVSKELAHHTSKLSTYLEHFRKISDAGKGDELATHIDDIHKELQDVRGKVDEWNSSGRLKKAFLSDDHAEELKGYQDTVYNALEELQAGDLLVSLKTSDLVLELKNAEIRAERRRLLACLGDGSYGARGNSIEEVVCLPGTRVEILKRIDEWIKDTSGSAERVLWIRGMAGRGKSTIASTVAHSWASKGSCAIFHFRRGQNALEGQFICALARQLGKGLVPEVKNAILDCVRESEDIAKERLDEQFKTLFVGSLAKLQNHMHPIIIIADALDECKNVADTVRFVRLIDLHSSFLPANVKFLLTCRPEAPLLVALEPRRWHTEDLDTTSDTNEDIARFVQHAFAQIREDHGLPETWPSLSDLEGIVEMSQGLFQWARTAIAYISHRSPGHRLQELLRRSSAWGGLDDLYHQIISRAFGEVERDPMRGQLLSWILGTLVVAPFPASPEVIAYLYADHVVFEGQSDIVEFLRGDILADLNSLLHVPTSPSEPVRLMHTSIRDLLVARERCGHQRYFVDTTDDHRRLAGVTLQIMARNLRQNICDLPHVLMANSEIQHVVDNHVTKGLRYCCRAWSIHLTTGVTWSESTAKATNIILDQFRVVSEEKLLFWLEVMSFIGATPEAGLVAKRVHQWLLEWSSKTPDDLLISLWNDIRRFIAAFIEPISFGALHIYASALPQCPVGTKLWEKYSAQATTRILLGKRPLNWRKTIWASSTGGPVSAIAFSPDGALLVSGSSGEMLRFWDAETGAHLGGPMTNCHTGNWSIAFSPDCKILASGSDDKIVRLWDVQTGALLGDPLVGHNGWVGFVCFSPNGKILASASQDGTVRLWDPHTGSPLNDPLTSYDGLTKSISFSPDSKVLAFGSDDNTIRLWDAQSGAPVGDPLTCPRSHMNPILFSPDGKVLASASNDAVQLWDAQTRAPLGNPLTGHRSFVRSIAFSPDCKILASGSDDRTIRLWDPQTGAPIADFFTGHRGNFGSVVFSPDGKVLASAWSDDTIRLWDPETGASLSDPLTSGDFGAHCIAFSPDSKLLASGGSSRMVRVWDAQIEASFGDSQTDHGSWIADPLSSPACQAPAPGSHDEAVRVWDAATGVRPYNARIRQFSVARLPVFSPDGKVLACRWSGEVVRLWDAHTGMLFGDPLMISEDPRNRITFSPDSKVLASLSEKETVRLWNAQTGASIGSPLSQSSDICAFFFSPDGSVLATESVDMTAQLWDTQTGGPLCDPLIRYSGEREFVMMDFSPDSKVLVAELDGSTIQLWDARTGALLGDPMTGHSDGIISFAFSPDGNALVYVSGDGMARLWDVQTGAPLGGPRIFHAGSAEYIVFSPDGATLAFVSSEEWSIRRWDVRAGAPMGDPLTGCGRSVSSVAFSPDGKVLASAFNDGTGRLWDAQTGVPLGDPLIGFQRGSPSIAFSPDSKVLEYTMHYSDNVRLWDARTGAPLGDSRLINHGHGSAVQLWDPLPHQLHIYPVHFNHQSLRVNSNWILWNSKRLMWFPLQYPHEVLMAAMFPFRSLAVNSSTGLSIFDVSRSLNL